MKNIELGLYYMYRPKSEPTQFIKVRISDISMTTIIEIHIEMGSSNWIRNWDWKFSDNSNLGESRS